MKNKNKVLALVMSAAMLFTAACGSESSAMPSAPDYSASTKEYRYYAYSSLHDGQIDVEGKTFDVGTDFRNAQYISEYFDSGMKLMMPQTSASAGSGARADWENSQLKNVLDITHDLGYDRSVIVTDNLIYAVFENAKMATTNKYGSNVAKEGYTEVNGEMVENWKLFSCIGDDAERQFPNEAALDAHVEELLSLYSGHPAFVGVMIPDEPNSIYLKPWGELYLSIMRVAKKNGWEDWFYINANLLPPTYVVSSYTTRFPLVEEDFSDDTNQDAAEAWRRYIERWFLCTIDENGKSAPFVQWDIYPLNSNDAVYRAYIVSLQVAAQEAKKYGAKINLVSQSICLNSDRILKYSDLMYLNNMQMGFGAVNIGYFTYYTHEDYIGVETYNDNGSMVTRFGEKTDIYYYMQQLCYESQKLAPVILNYDYRTNKLYKDENCGYDSQHVDFPMMTLNYEQFDDFVKLIDFELNKEMAVVTELYDDEKDLYMYMVCNAINPQSLGVGAYETATMTFSSDCTHAWVYFKGEFKVVELEEGNKLTVKINPGEAYYVVPFAE